MTGKIKVLIVEDEMADEIKEGIEDFSFNGAECQFEIIKTLNEAKRLITKKWHQKQFYDLMIIDLNLGGNGMEGMEIFNLGLSCIKIVFTIEDDIRNCVQCLKAGAFDYIVKNSKQKKYNAYKLLKESMRLGLDERLKEKEDTFLVWVNKNNKELTGQYGGKYIAVIDGIVVGSDNNYNRLKDDVNEKYPFFQPRFINIPLEGNQV